MKQLEDTVTLMCSDDYKDRFKAEYYQVLYRVVKLAHILDTWDTLEFTPVCPKSLLEDQEHAMRHYLQVLLQRARVEDIDL